ncbi:hypothetical protein Q5424_08330 [Conexibacter sp. JD483]|uniref:hypothetical protein n=1 Tax=unclassified Conexibacter TaxID=2627773 RepID=UPI00271DA3C3|nr:MULTISPECIES: hypothetical protein [unclassified Conexibacter]MDO8183955.1 hypothetical protein [Conexibacter sp. CPCC 205706]MDO8196947.1 hypothetical protein [Conexibacter sp. CPCC 205762]MDR9369083.1 hypothetical protein [Conexibacter sp. JD483]
MPARRSSRQHSNAVIGAAAALAVIAAAAVGVAIAVFPGNAESAAPRATTTVAASSIPAELRDSFAVLRRAPQPGDAIDDPLNVSAAKEVGAVAEDAREVRPEGLGVHLVPGTAGPCLLITDASMGRSGAGRGAICQSPTRFQKTRLWLVYGLDDPRSFWLVLVPDGVEQITATTTPGGHAPAAVINNAAVVRDPTNVLRISWTDQSTETHEATMR